MKTSYDDRSQVKACANFFFQNQSWLRNQSIGGYFRLQTYGFLIQLSDFEPPALSAGQTKFQ